MLGSRMVTKEAVDKLLEGILDKDFIPTWWTLKIGKLDYHTPDEMWEIDPMKVMRVAEGYFEPLAYT